MIRNELTGIDGSVVWADCYDLATGTYRREEYGTVVAERPMTADEITANSPPVDAKAELLARIEQATTLTKLRAAVLAAIESL